MPNSVTELEEEENNQVKIYPNPTTGNVTLEYALAEDQIGTLEVFDLMGKRVRSTTLSGAGPWYFTVDNLSSGLYSVRVLVDNKVVLSEKVSILRR